MSVNDIEVSNPQIVSPVDKLLSEPLISEIVSLVRKYTGQDVRSLQVKSRKRHLVFPRQLNMYFLEKHTNYSLAMIGSIFNRDHATVLHAKKTIQNLIDTDKRIRNQYHLIEESIDAHKNLDKTTKYSIFQELLGSLNMDDKERKQWVERYVEAL